MIKYILSSNFFFDRKFLKYYGVGLFQYIRIKSLFGFSIPGCTPSLDRNMLFNIDRYIQIYFSVENILKKRIIKRIEFFTTIKIYRSYRFRYWLPVHGQRTRTNSKTVRRLPRVQYDKYGGDTSNILIN